MTQITTTMYPSRWESRGGTRRVWERAALAHSMSSAGPSALRKEHLPVLCGATFRDGHRCLASVEAVHVLGLDDDHPTADPDGWTRRVHTSLGGVELFVHSTFSSLRHAYRMRALVPQDAVGGAEHRASARLAARVLERDGIVVDRATHDPCRAWYVWAVPPSGAYYARHIPGAPWPARQAAAAELARVAREQERRERTRHRVVPTGDRVERARRYLARMDAAISGAHGHDATYRAALALVRGFALDADAALALLCEWNERCSPPWSARDLRRKVEQASRADRVPDGYLLSGRAR